MSLHKIFILASIILYFSISFVSTIYSQELIIGYVEFPPMTYTDQKGKPAGYIMDIATKSLEKAGFTWDAVSLPASKLSKLLTIGKIHVWLGLKTMPGFTDNTYISETVVEKLTLRAYTIGNKPPIHSLQDLKGKTLLILRGYSYGGWTRYIKDPANNIRYLEIQSHERAFSRLEKLSKRIDELYLLDYKHPSDKVLQKLELKNIKFNQVSSLDMHFVVTKHMHRAQAVLTKIEKAYTQLSEAGLFQTTSKTVTPQTN